MSGLVSEIIQGSDEWRALRCGKVTASRVADIIRTTKSGFSTSRANYMAELIAERLTGTSPESFKSTAMQWGTDQEANARSAYELLRDCDVTEVAFVEHPTIQMSGASPDGLVHADGVVEFKCPLTATHLDTLLGGAIPADYITQMQWQMACLPERKWCDWVSFDPRLPATMQLFVQRVKRDDKKIGELESAVIVFQSELEEKLAALNARYSQQKAA